MLGLIPFDHVLPIKLRVKPLGEVVDRSRSLLKAIRLSAKPKGFIVVCVGEQLLFWRKRTAALRVGAEEITTAFFKTVEYVDGNLAVVSNATAFVSSKSFAYLSMR